MDAKELGQQPATPTLCQWDQREDRLKGAQVGASTSWVMGLTKRELFAAMAMQGLLANPFYAEEIRNNEFDISAAKQSVYQADQLLAELAKEQP